MNISEASNCFMVLFVGMFVIMIAIYLYQINKIGHNVSENMTNENNIEFDSISVLDSTIPTIVLFYSSKCSTCHKFLPDYQMLKEKYKDNPKYKIAIINCDKNPSFGITKYPTIRHYTNPRKKEYKTIFE